MKERFLQLLLMASLVIFVRKGGTVWRVQVLLCLVLLESIIIEEALWMILTVYHVRPDGIV